MIRSKALYPAAIYPSRKTQIRLINYKLSFGIFLGYIVIGLLNHDWSNEAAATQGWLLTGLVIPHNVRPSSAKKDNIKQALRKV